MKKFFYITISFTIFFSFILNANFKVFATEKEDELKLTENARASILIERDTGAILYEKNAHEKLPPASLTKVMTLLLVMEAIAEGKLKLDEMVTVSENAASMGGSQVFLAEGEQMSVEDLIKAVAIASANDASVALAERIAGSETAFVKRMNEKAEELGLKNTSFANASGLPAPNHYTTAYDMALMSKELLKYEDITKFTSIYEDYLRKGEENEFWLVNTNRLVRFSPYVDGLKTGYTKEAKYCLALTAKKDGMRVISVIMGADSAKERNAMSMRLIDYAFSHFETEKIFEKGETVGQFKHMKTKKYAYDLKTSEPISLLKKKGEKDVAYTTEIKLFDKPLPIKKNEAVGMIVIRTNDETVYESPLYASEEIEFGSIVALMKRAMWSIVKYD